jgi:hypothetical protein
MAYQFRADSHQFLFLQAPGVVIAQARYGTPDIWDSGKVLSSETSVLYAGKPLVSRSLVYWTVRIWDKHDRVSDWTPINSFSVGLLSQKEWDGWIHRTWTMFGENSKIENKMSSEKFPADANARQTSLATCDGISGARANASGGSGETNTIRNHGLHG